MVRHDTPFITRSRKEDGTVSILPTLPGAVDGECLCVDSGGSWGSCIPWVVVATTGPASDAEIEQARTTLADAGFNNPQPYRRVSMRMRAERRATRQNALAQIGQGETA